MSRFTILAAVLGVLFLAAACTEQEPEITLDEQVPAEVREDNDEPANDEAPDDADVVESVTLQAVDIDYENPPSELPAGTIEFTLENTGNLPHDLRVDELDVTVVDVIDGGETETGQVTLEPGTYTFYCSVPGHRDAGMFFEVDVTG